MDRGLGVGDLEGPGIVAGLAIVAECLVEDVQPLNRNDGTLFYIRSKGMDPVLNVGKISVAGDGDGGEGLSCFLSSDFVPGLGQQSAGPEAMAVRVGMPFPSSSDFTIRFKRDRTLLSTP